MRKTKILVSALVILIIAAAIVHHLYFSQESNPYSFTGKSFSYSENRGALDYNLSLKEVNGSTDIYTANYQSRPLVNYSTRIYGLVFIPSNKTNLPGLVLLPGGGVNKEDESRLAMKISSLGYAVIVIDQRGIGQTGGYYLSPEQDYSVFAQGYEPMQHLAVFDALRAYDLLFSLKQINKSNIAVSGESMGGRYAIIAAALDKRIKGALLISTSGFHFDAFSSLPYTPYLISVDPDNYISRISPNPVFFIHSTKDNIIPLNDSLQTFSLAKEPKNFTSIDTCGHGYCEDMFPAIQSDLKQLFGQ